MRDSNIFYNELALAQNGHVTNKCGLATRRCGTHSPQRAAQQPSNNPNAHAIVSTKDDNKTQCNTQRSTVNHTPRTYFQHAT